jgi:hypothetical protein
MEAPEYMIEVLIREKLDEARAATARRALAAGARPRPSLRARLGAALIALGERLVGAPASPRSCPSPSASHG